MKKFIFSTIVILMVLMIGGAFWNRDVQKDSQMAKYQDKIASQEKRILELEDSILRLKDTLEVFEMTWDVLRGTDSTAVEGLLKYIWKVYDGDLFKDFEPIHIQCEKVKSLC